ncbi:MAG: hypothetical protein QXL17_05975 [Candidatus Thermoplasmatota archaeon]
MRLFRTLQSIMLISIFLISTLHYCCIFETTVKSEVTAQPTILYFTPYNPFYLEDEFESIQMSLTPPTTTNDSVWPPQLFKQVDGKRIRELNTDEILTWIELWVMYKFSQFDEFYGNETEELPDEFDQYFKQLFDLFNPFKIQEDFIYIGEEPAEISGKILYNLYFSSNSNYIGSKDSVKISIAKKELLFGELPISTEIKNSTATIHPTLPKGKTKLTSIELNLENQTIYVEPEEIISFSVEIIPTQHLLSKLFKLAEKHGFADGKYLNKLADFLSNRKLETFQQWGESLHEFIDEINVFSEEGINLSISDIGEIVDALQGSSFVFASKTHPSHVLLPLTVVGDTENSKVYYLHDQNNMNEQIGTNTNPVENDFSKNSISWYGPPLERSKILKYASASLYINARNLLRKTSITVSLYNGEKLLSTTTQVLARDLLITKPQEPVIFNFENINQEINYGNRLTLSVGISDNAKRGLLGKISVIYDTETYASQLALTFTETENIQVTSTVYPPNQQIVPGGSLRYIFSISSKKSDDITLSYKTKDPEPTWMITILGNQTKTYTAGQNKQVIVYVNSTDPTKRAYKETIDITFIISGKTGYVKQKTQAKISEEAVVVDVQIIGYTKEVTKKKGDEAHFYIVIQNNNTAAIDDTDSYTITAQSSRHWAVDNTKSIKNIQTGKRTDPYAILIVVSIPKNTSFESDTITVTIRSDTDPTKTATVTLRLIVSGPDFFETITKLLKPLYDSMSTLAQSLGLNELFGAEFAPILLIMLIMVIILCVFIILTLVLTKKTFRIICTQRIQEIQSDQIALFSLTIKNLTKKTQTYLLTTHPQSTDLWRITIDQPQVTIPGNNHQDIHLSVQPTHILKPKDWIAIDVYVSPINQRKKQKITLMTMIHDGSPCLQITDVHHLPSEFTAGEQILTLFKLVNKGSVTAHNVQVLLYINGKQKNKIVVTIPSKSYADISLPWIAGKGKNKIRIKIIEQ